MNKALKEKRLGQRQLYEVLLSQKVIAPNSEKDFKKIFEWAVDNNYVDKNRLKRKGKKRGKLPKYFTKDQLIKIFDAVDRPKDAVACYLALVAGLRINEVCNLQVEDIDFKRGELRVVDSKNPNRGIDNYGTDRIVPFPACVQNPVKAWIDYIGETSKWVIPSDKTPDKPLRKKSLHERFRGYLKQAGLLQVDYTIEVTQKVNGNKITKKVDRHKYYFHCFRHTAGSKVQNDHNDVALTQAFLGHKQIDTTMVYAKLTPTRAKKAIGQTWSSNEYEYKNGQLKVPAQKQEVVEKEVVKEKPTDRTKDMLLAEQQRIIQEMGKGNITRDECQRMLNDIKEVSGFI